MKAYAFRYFSICHIESQRQLHQQQSQRQNIESKTGGQKNRENQVDQQQHCEKHFETDDSSALYIAYNIDRSNDVYVTFRLHLVVYRREQSLVSPLLHLSLSHTHTRSLSLYL